MDQNRVSSFFVGKMTVRSHTTYSHRQTVSCSLWEAIHNSTCACQGKLFTHSPPGHMLKRHASKPGHWAYFPASIFTLLLLSIERNLEVVSASKYGGESYVLVMWPTLTSQLTEIEIFMSVPRERVWALFAGYFSGGSTWGFQFRRSGLHFVFLGVLRERRGWTQAGWR